MKSWNLVVVIITIQLGLCLSKCMRRGIECLDYTIIAKNPEYEERQYPSTLWISTSTKGKSLSRAQIYMYKKLFRYIQGDNLKGLFINSTAPTRTKVTPCVNDELCETSYTMSLPMPSEMYVEPPIPTNVDLFFDREPPTRYVVRSFGGRPSESQWLTEAQKIADFALKDTGVQRDHYYLNWYDPPLQLFNRLNEVWLTKSLAKRPANEEKIKDANDLNEVC